ncbi:hypothetical protein CJD36_005625 [Flavipsychrobacter stenotrophus]|uniref:Outer membrane protein beta-barrel domain-containing protein n=2 Tax=Flavipsychrobacter stenotrophus TaxID=2077091 RepID=A0A2S7SWJ0_9BACT|nr:hypothetical protein CJD36_005625 [Flavipsychrobacter stenotrophus]
MFFLSAIQSSAQLSFRIIPFSGYGISGIHIATSATPSYSYKREGHYQSHGSFAGGVLAGVCGGRAGFTTGLQFLSDGMTYVGTESIYHGLGSGGSYTTGNFSDNTRFSHLVVPAILSFRFFIDSAITFVPGIGVETSFNLRSKTYSKDIYDDQHTLVMSGTEFAKYYAPVTASLMLQANIEVALSKKSFLYAGLTYRYMISDFLRSPYAAGYIYGFQGILGFGFNMSQLKHNQVKRPVNPVNQDD